MSSTIALVTGSNRGLGRALVEELVARGAAKVYAASRTGEGVPRLPRVVPLALDVTSPASVRAAAATARDVTLLVNNAGTLAAGTVLAGDRDGIARDLAVNYHGVLDVVRAFEPHLGAGAAIAPRGRSPSRCAASCAPVGSASTPCSRDRSTPT